MEATTNTDTAYAIFRIDHSVINKNLITKEKRDISADWLYSSRNLQSVRDKLADLLREFSTNEFKILCNNPDYYSVHNNTKVAGLLSYSRNTELLYEYMILTLNNPKKKL